MYIYMYICMYTYMYICVSEQFMLQYIHLLANVSHSRHFLLSAVREQRRSEFFIMFITKRLMLFFCLYVKLRVWE